MTLNVDDAAELIYARIVRGLKTARQDAQLSRHMLSSSLPVTGKAVFEWEAGNIQPTTEHLLLWVRTLSLRLELVDSDCELRSAPTRRLAGESWATAELRRLAIPLRNSRRARGVTLQELGSLIGVTKTSVQRWEGVRAAPRPLALVVWAQVLDLSLVLRADKEDPPTRMDGAT